MDEIKTFYEAERRVINKLSLLRIAADVAINMPVKIVDEDKISHARIPLPQPLSVEKVMSVYNQLLREIIIADAPPIN